MFPYNSRMRDYLVATGRAGAAALADASRGWKRGRAIVFAKGKGGAPAGAHKIEAGEQVEAGRHSSSTGRCIGQRQVEGKLGFGRANSSACFETETF